MGYRVCVGCVSGVYRVCSGAAGVREGLSALTRACLALELSDSDSSIKESDGCIVYRVLIQESDGLSGTPTLEQCG